MQLRQSNGLNLVPLKCKFVLFTYLALVIDFCLIWSVSYLFDLNVYFPSVSDLIPPGACNLLNSSTIYANNEVDLSEVDIYGFDYDYTLALYSNALNTLIYNTARSFLIEHFKVCRTVVASSVVALPLLVDSDDIILLPLVWQYPEGIRKYDYVPNFAVRGLHYDIQKVNSF